MKAEKLFEILDRNQLISIHGDINQEVNEIIIDSRKAEKNNCFIAIKGNVVDGHNYIESVVLNNVTLIVCEEIPSKPYDHVCYVKVKDTKKVTGLLAHQLYGNPSRKLTVIGVTGTNGKTTVATLLYQLYTELGYKCGLISTVENVIAGRIIPSTHTTPDAVSLARLMKEMFDNDCEYIFMEVSSHALDQDRTNGVQFKAALFTNITHDHLDYHKTFLSYINAKKKFFDDLTSSSIAIINTDDNNGKVMVQNCDAKVLTYGLRSLVDYKCKVLSNDISGLQLKINNHEVNFLMSGEFNAYNLLAVYALATELGEDETKVLSILSTLQGAEGRMQKVIDVKTGKVGIIDYAHTPDALENVLKTINDSLSGDQKVITVTGCGGDRDKTKRPLMAKIAADLSDRLIMTSDNPRSEDPEEILKDMEKGLDLETRLKCLKITDRAMAIKTAVMLANRNDVILVAGKGHEKYQEIKGQKFPFEDKKILLDAFEGNI